MPRHALTALLWFFSSALYHVYVSWLRVLSFPYHHRLLLSCPATFSLVFLFLFAHEHVRTLLFSDTFHPSSFQCVRSIEVVAVVSYSRYPVVNSVSLLSHHS